MFFKYKTTISPDSARIVEKIMDFHTKFQRLILLEVNRTKFNVTNRNILLIITYMYIHTLITQRYLSDSGRATN